MPYGSDSANESLQVARRKREGITPGDDDVPDSLMLAYIVEHGFDFSRGSHPTAVSPFPLTGAVSAEHRANISKHQKHPVRVAVNQSRNHRVRFFIQRVFCSHGTHNHLHVRRYRLLHYWVIGIVGVDQR